MGIEEVNREASAGAGQRAPRRRGSGKQGRARLGPRTGPLTVFIHIPKTAGTTFGNILRANFPPGAVGNLGNVFKGRGGVDPAKLKRVHASGPMLTRKLSALAGHYPFGVRSSLPDDTRYITFLRNPVERTLSHYYSLLEVRRRDPLPEGSTLEQILADGDYMHDNLQTRMLSDHPAPFGDATEEMLEQAKANLENAFLAFGLVERFDESLVLFQRRLGLQSVLYVRQRVTNRPHEAEVPDELIRAAERYNEYDLELYRVAAELFERTVEEQGVEYAIDLAALRKALSPGIAQQPPPVPAASEVDRRQLWEMVVDRQAELLARDQDLVEARLRPDTQEDDDLRPLLEQTKATLTELNRRLVRIEAKIDRNHGVADRAPEPADEAPSGDEAEGAARPRGGRKKAGRQGRPAAQGNPRARALGNLERVQERIRELEAEGNGAAPEDAQDELTRLRATESRVKRRIDALDRRADPAGGADPEIEHDAGTD
jgi:hypothetical protein